MVNFDEKVTINRVLNVALTIVLVELLIFGWWYVTRNNPAEWLSRNILPTNAQPRHLYTIYGGNGLNFKRPSFTAVNNNRIYVADTNNSRIAVFDYNGRYQSQIGASGQGSLVYPVSICFVENTIYVADAGTKKIHLYDIGGKFIGYFAVDAVKEPNSIFYKGRKFFVVDNHEMKIRILDIEGRELKSFGKKGIAAGQFYFPYSVYVSAQNKIYIADSNNNRIQVFDLSGNLIEILAGRDTMGEGKYSVPRGTAFDRDGNLYTAEGLINSVSVTNRQGEVIRRFSNAESSTESGVKDAINLPTSVFIDDNQRLYVTEFGKSRVLVYSL